MLSEENIEKCTAGRKNQERSIHLFPLIVLAAMLIPMASTAELTIDALLAGIAGYESSIQDFVVLYSYVRPSVAGRCEWKPYTMLALYARRGDLRLCERFDFRTDWDRMRHGIAVFDGQYSRTWLNNNTGKILPRMHSDFYWNGSIEHYCCSTWAGMPISAFVKEAAEAELEGVQLVDGHECGVIAVGGHPTMPRAGARFYFDVARGFVPLKVQRLMNGQIVAESLAAEVRKVDSTGVWFPTKVTITTAGVVEGPGGAPTTTIMVRRLKVNAGFGQDLFSFEYPEGVIIQDEVVDSTYRIPRSEDDSLRTTPADSVPTFFGKALDLSFDEAVEMFTNLACE